jgi:hypothetical protein
MDMTIAEFEKHKPPTIQEMLSRASPHILGCLRCGWTWHLRGAGPDNDRLPGSCPKCKSAYWNEPRKCYRCTNCRRRGDARDCAHCGLLRSRAVEEIEAAGRLVCPRCKRYGPVPGCRDCEWLNPPVNEPTSANGTSPGEGKMDGVTTASTPPPPVKNALCFRCERDGYKEGCAACAYLRQQYREGAPAGAGAVANVLCSRCTREGPREGCAACAYQRNQYREGKQVACDSCTRPPAR